MPLIKAGAFDLDYADTGSGPAVSWCTVPLAAVASGNGSLRPCKAATA